MSLLSQLLDISTRGKALYYTQSPPIPESGGSEGGRKSKLIHPKPPFFFSPPFSHLPCFFYLLLYALSPLLFWTQRGGKGDGDRRRREKQLHLHFLSSWKAFCVPPSPPTPLTAEQRFHREGSQQTLFYPKKPSLFKVLFAPPLPIVYDGRCQQIFLSFFPQKVFLFLSRHRLRRQFCLPAPPNPTKKATKHSCCSRLYYDAATKQREKYRYSLGPAPSPLWPTRWDPLVAHTRLAHKEGP